MQPRADAAAPAISERSPPEASRLGIPSALDFFADTANAIPDYRMFTILITRIIAFARCLFGEVLRFVREAVVRPLAALAEGTAGYGLSKAVIGFDPVTGQAVPRTGYTIIGGFIDGLASIAAGNINAAAARVEAMMAGLLTLVISFLARIAGLGQRRGA
jgi:hypothetical protein